MSPFGRRDDDGFVQAARRREHARLPCAELREGDPRTGTTILSAAGLIEGRRTRRSDRLSPRSAVTRCLNAPRLNAGRIATDSGYLRTKGGTVGPDGGIKRRPAAKLSLLELHCFCSKQARGYTAQCAARTQEVDAAELGLVGFGLFAVLIKRKCSM